METIYDRGRISVRKEVDGTVTVVVSADVLAGEPKGVYAIYRKVTDLKIDSAVSFHEGGEFTVSDGAACIEMVSGGTVEVRPIVDLRMSDFAIEALRD